MNHRHKPRQRWGNIWKASMLYHSRPSQELIAFQNQVMNRIESVIDSEGDRFFKDCPLAKDVGIYDFHIHRCAYEIMRPRDIGWQKSMCRKWCKEHVRLPDDCSAQYDKCDLCSKQTLVTFSICGDVMFASRTSPELIQNILSQNNHEQQVESYEPA